MKASIRDQLTGADVTIALIGNSASMTANGMMIETTIRASDISMARVAVSKRDLTAFGSFFDEA